MPTEVDHPVPAGQRGAMVPAKFNSDGSIVLKRSPTIDLKRIFLSAMRKSSIKTLFKYKRTRARNPVDVVRNATSLLSYLNSPTQASGTRHAEKMADLVLLIREMKVILYGGYESEPAPEPCAQLTQEFFRGNTLRLLILCLPKLNLEARKDATQIVANLQRQPVNSRLVASEYLESNLDLMDPLILGYEDPAVALHYGSMLRECIRHQTVAKHVLKSEHMSKLFEYIQLPNFDIAADATATFKELMTRHKSTVAEYLSENYGSFFNDFNSKLLESQNYITRRQAIKLLGDMLLERSNSSIMVRYVSSKENLRILMNLLRESSKTIQLDTFHVFKLFVANKNKPPEIVSILFANRNKLLLLLSNFKTDKDDGSFEADKAEVVKEIMGLQPGKWIRYSGGLRSSSCGGIDKLTSFVEKSGSL